jgi:hypothetical protein
MRAASTAESGERRMSYACPQATLFRRFVVFFDEFFNGLNVLQNKLGFFKAELEGELVFLGGFDDDHGVAFVL